MIARYQAVPRHAQADAFASTDPIVAFADRAVAVSHARRQCCAGFPCDVIDTTTGELVYRREMDVAASRAQGGLFS